MNYRRDINILTGFIVLFAMTTQFVQAGTMLLFNDPIEIPVAESKLLGLDKPQLKRDWKIITFGYVHCTDICPITLTNLKKMIEAGAKHSKSIEGIFVSLDPDRDSEEVLDRYLSNYNENIVFSRLPKAELEKISEFFNVEYRDYNKRAGVNHYIIDHSSTAFVLDSQNRLIAAFDSNKSIEDIMVLLNQS